MAKILNIDSLATTPRVLHLGGTEYPIDELTVENFIATTKEAEKLKDEKSQAVQMEATVDMIVRSIPGVPREKLLKLSLDNLLTIVRFVQGSLEDDTAGVTDTGEEKK